MIGCKLLVCHIFLGEGPMKTQYQRLLDGELYESDDTIVEMKRNARDILSNLNTAHLNDSNTHKKLINDLLGEVGDNIYIKPPFYCSHGKHIRVGSNFFCNFNCIFLDLGLITIGDNVMIGPRVSIYTALHPIDAMVRNTHLEYALPVTIKDNVWIAGDVVINPGVTIGSGSIIGSGSVVTKDIPDNVIAFGNPCIVHRVIDDNDKDEWKQKLNAFNLEV